MSGLAEIIDENRRLRESMSAIRTSLEAERVAHDVELARRDAEIETRDTELAARDSQLRAQEAMLEAVRRRAEELARQLEFIQMKARGPASQRFIPETQQMLPLLGEITPPPRAPRPEPIEPSPSALPTNRPTPKRRNREDFRSMPSRPVTCKASAETCVRCGEALTVIGQAKSFRVEWVPGHFIVEDVLRDKCACPRCPGEGVLTVPGPYALDRGLCGNNLLARVLIDKHDDHLPLNRQARRMQREGFEVGTNTLASWVKESAKLLSLVSNAVRKELLEGPFLQGDDTGFPVQDGGDGVLRKGRMWAFTNQEQVFYRFTPTKHGEYPAALLEKFAGDLLLVDGGSEFNEVVREQGLERGGCWSHLRTYFYDARHYHPVEAALALGTIRDLFLIERAVHGTPCENILATRKHSARPLVDGFFLWVQALSTSVRPESKLGEAIRYARNQERALRLHLEHAELPMHNNLSELMLRQTVVGRKNWLFARSEGGAEAAGHIYTLVGSCKLQGIDPHAYLVDVLGKIQDHPSNRVRELTPKAWRLARQGHTPDHA
jgi:transposase